VAALAAVLVFAVALAGGAFSAPGKVAGVSAVHAGRPGPRGPRGPAGPPGPSNAYATYNDGPVAIPVGQPTKLVSLTIPKPGNYVILAKMFASDQGNTPEIGDVTCQLDAHGDLDSTTVTESEFFNRPLSLEVVHTFTAAGSVDFNCGAEATLRSGQANWIKIVAIRVGSLTNTKG
jgi:hypothetical protein